MAFQPFSRSHFNTSYLVSLCYRSPLHFLLTNRVFIKDSFFLFIFLPKCSHLPYLFFLGGGGFVLWCMIAKGSADIWQIWDTDLRRVSQVS